MSFFFVHAGACHRVGGWTCSLISSLVTEGGCIKIETVVYTQVEDRRSASVSVEESNLLMHLSNKYIYILGEQECSWRSWYSRTPVPYMQTADMSYKKKQAAEQDRS